VVEAGSQAVMASADERCRLLQDDIGLSRHPTTAARPLLQPLVPELKQQPLPARRRSADVAPTARCDVCDRQAWLRLGTTRTPIPLHALQRRLLPALVSGRASLSPVAQPEVMNKEELLAQI
jgi:hypothetical protein